ncbi:hypothetical protein [Streptosporangium carneum]|uniref:Uncharacterized protein n=1 Tax=Streptosporangium carneum TaxID=47481 RepID=A0A9W6HW05_9ACTN|nr:hypothetical protein [Streptosporangium carneum]GLK07395.1 hypothetical protein GCM10017600_08000 [Streptosporangium carneum]
MFKKLPGDEAQRLVSTTPDTAVVFRPAIVRTPALVTLVIYAWRLLAGLMRLLWRHPIASAVAALPGVIWTVYGWPYGLGVVALLLAVPTGWALIHRPSFLHLIGWRLLAFWRLVWVYRRHWQPVMTISGLARQVSGREYLPHLVAVSCTSWADLVTVKILTGQAVTDWADRVEHLAHGFGAASCRVTITRSGRLLLTFPAATRWPFRCPPSRSRPWRRWGRWRSAAARTALRGGSRSTAPMSWSRALPGRARAR